MSTDTSEKGLEDLIVEALVGVQPEEMASRGVQDEKAERSAHDVRRPAWGGLGYRLGNATDYDRDHAVDVTRLLDFLWTTQPEFVEAVQFDHDSKARKAFLDRLQGEITNVA